MWTTFETTSGQTLSYMRRGEGPLVVCFPGGPGLDPLAYYATLELPGHELLIFAPRGVGASSSPNAEEAYSTGGYVQDVEALRLHLNAERLTLYGSSHGAMVALAYACARPGRVEKLVLVATPLRFDDAYRAAIVTQRRRFSEAVSDGAQRLAAADEASSRLADETTDPAQRPGLMRAIFTRYVVEEGHAETQYLDALCAAPINFVAQPQTFRELSDPHRRPLQDAAGVTAPALVVVGALDTSSLPANAHETADALDNGRAVELPGVGHFPEVEAAELMGPLVAEFLSD
jgi:proline iminopeptidase